MTEKKGANKPYKKRYAFIKDPVIEAVVNGYYVFQNKEQGAKQLGIIKERYVISREGPGEGEAGSCILWIKGYEVTPEETEKGFIGNFALISLEQRDVTEWRFSVRKLEAESRIHPQRKRPDARHPNWGHPILRSVQKQRVYFTIEEAQSELHILQQEYPQAAVPGANRLFIMIFSRKEGEENPIKRYILEIKIAPNGGFFIDCTLNPNQGKKKPKLPENAEPMGHFASKVVLGKARKKRTLPPIPKQPEE